MPLADPDARAAYNRQRWQTHGQLYRAQRTSAQPPVSRQQVLDEDVSQARALERLEARRVGAARAAAAFKAWLTGERRWIRVTSTPFVIGGLDVAD